MKFADGKISRNRIDRQRIASVFAQINAHIADAGRLQIDIELRQRLQDGRDQLRNSDMCVELILRQLRLIDLK
ncbi:hypothetical protein SDC9_194318 [bioreactor metagenome]|uniref:Uncharacterized protein n=1 Tax=bioreactor metagenome TaxID=1076179 RepID=A0A645I5Y4_9ZZZZ